MSTAKLTMQSDTSTIKLTSDGDWLADEMQDIFPQLAQINCHQHIQHISWDFSRVEKMDAVALVTILHFFQRFDPQKVSFSITGLKENYQRMLIFYRKNASYHKPVKPPVRSLFYQLGKSVINKAEGLLSFAHFVGECSYHFYQTLLHPSLLRISSTSKHIEQSGLYALPIIGLTAFLIGLVIAYQSTEQLARFGANIFIVEMVSISIFRELAPMIAAIVVAGRSASAYTAEIGTMKITEENDAMRTMGFEPQQFLVLPRLFALVLSMPLIVFFADMMGVLGGMLIAFNELDISFSKFLARMQTEVPIKHLIIGLIKAPFFGIIIATIGTFRGFQVTGSTDSIGYYTTVSVVNAIFWVIVANAMNSILLTEIGI